MAKWTPMMEQYHAIKKEHSAAILFFRLGDFYEMFFADAEVASRELDLTLTGRDAGQAERVPMAGIPYHAADNYIAKLIARGYTVAICEQVEDPKTAKGVVRREVIRVISPGTVVDPGMLQEKQNNYLAAAVTEGERSGIAAVDVTTGEFKVTEISGTDGENRLLDEFARLNPAEILLPEGLYNNANFRNRLSDSLTGKVAPVPAWSFDLNNARRTLTEHFQTASLEGFGCEHLTLAVRAAGAVLAYLQETQKMSLSHLTRLTTYATEEYMVLDRATRRNLELTQTLRDGQKTGSLLWVLDHTGTAMGGRMLRAWIEQPLLNRVAILHRLDAVAELVGDSFRRGDLQELNSRVYDLERLLGRIVYGSANARDLVALKLSLELVPRLREILQGAQTTGLQEIRQNLDPLTDVVKLIGEAIVDDPPFSLREGNIIKPGYHPDVGKYREAATGGKTWIADFETKEKERTGIKSLKVGFNRVFGYYLTITNTHSHLVPADYNRKQTLVNAERYTTPELQEYESLILGAEEKLAALEFQIFETVRQSVSAQAARLQTTARNIAGLDAICSLAEAAIRHNYCQPVLNEGDAIRIKAGRHPVVEQVLRQESFVPNDTAMDSSANALVLLTGPNMAGKSTYMRQVALIVLMAQIGSFVPAATAEIGCVDRIFTRVGAYDDLVMGQSTFMVEMNEVANILNHATARSLIILDEIGRGTSTYDGLSIAWAVAEYIHDPARIGAKTLFATHYHELTELEEAIPGVVNYSVAVRERGEQVIFLRTIVRGGADRSYGIHVARLAGLPAAVLSRAKEILFALERGEDFRPGRRSKAKGARRGEIAPNQLSLFTSEPHPAISRLAALDLTNLTPLQSMNVLAELQAMVDEGDKANG